MLRARHISALCSAPSLPLSSASRRCVTFRVKAICPDVPQEVRVAEAVLDRLSQSFSRPTGFFSNNTAMDIAIAKVLDHEAATVCTIGFKASFTKLEYGFQLIDQIHGICMIRSYGQQPLSYLMAVKSPDKRHVYARRAQWCDGSQVLVREYLKQMARHRQDKRFIEPGRSFYCFERALYPTFER